jgi:G3E family GTPase
MFVGLADPTPISAMFLEVDLKDKFVLDGVVTVVDSLYFINQYEHGQKIQEKATGLFWNK